MESFSFSIPQNIVFGRGSLVKLTQIAASLNKSKALVISGPHLNKTGMVEECRKLLLAAGVESEAFTETEGNPGTETVDKAVSVFRDCKAEFIVALGGGSPLDVAKAAALLASYGGNITDYEGSGKVPGPVIPLIAIPTTAGTGSEVTAFSVITDHSRNYKLTVASSYLLPSYAIVDSELIQSVPKTTAAACGADAMIHALEAYISLASSPFSDMFALKALGLIGGNIRAYAANRGNEEAAEAMMLGSLFAGIAFSHARLGNVHAMSHPVSAFYNVAHGVANAILLPVVTEFNKLADKGKYFDIYKRVAKCPVRKSEFLSDMLARELLNLNVELGIPVCLRDVGVREESFEAMAKDAMKSGNILVNPRSTTVEDIINLYRKAF